MRQILLIVYLGMLAVFDLRERKIPVLLLGVGTVVAGCLRIPLFWAGDGEVLWQLCAVGVTVLPGLCMLGVAKLTGKIGLGDGWILINVGLFTDYKTCVVLWGVSMLLMSLTCMVLLGLRRVKRDTYIPYLPFLAAGGMLLYAYL